MSNKTLSVSELLVNFKNFLKSYVYLRSLTQLIYEAYAVCEMHSTLSLTLPSLLGRQTSKQRTTIQNEKCTRVFWEHKKELESRIPEKDFMKEKIKSQRLFYISLV